MSSEKNILLLGDSHADIFQNSPNVQRFANHAVVPTAQRLVDLNYTDLWSRLDPWLASAPADSDLVICINEIDIRVHYWRHLPRSELTILQYIHELAHKLYSRLVYIHDHYGLRRCLLWGAPPASPNAGYNADWPFCGPHTLRNRLIHLFNRAFIDLVVSSGSSAVSFETAYYKYVSSDFTTKDFASNDGVHYQAQIRDQLWSLIIDQLANPNHSHYPLDQYSHDFQYQVESFDCGHRITHDAWLDYADQHQALHRVHLLDRDWYFYQQRHILAHWAQVNQLIIA